MLIPSTSLITAATAGQDGWVNDIANAWTYVSASSFSTLGDRTTVFSKGTRIKVTDGSVKYFVVTSSSFGGGITTVNITGGTDYSLSGGVLNSNFYSYAANPQGFPVRFSFTPAIFAGSSGSAPTYGNSVITASFSITGAYCDFSIYITWGSTANFGTADYWTIEVGPINLALQNLIANVTAYDASGGYPGRYGMARSAGSNRVIMDTTYNDPGSTYKASTPFTWAQDDVLSLAGRYAI